MKKIISSILLVCILMSTFFVFPVSAANINSSNIVSEATKLKGTPYSKMDCSYFVCTVFEKCGMNLWKYRRNLTTATVDAGIAKTVGYSLDELFSKGKVGDLVHFPGHIAIYIGNKQVIHSTTSKGVTVSTLSKNSYWGGTGKKVDRIVRLNSVSSVKKPTISMTSYPTSIKKGTKFALQGTINPNGGAIEVSAYIKNSKGKKVQSTKINKSNSSRMFHIGCEDIVGQLSFQKLSKGTYTLVLTAKNSAGTSTFSKQFKVK